MSITCFIKLSTIGPPELAGSLNMQIRANWPATDLEKYLKLNVSPKRWTRIQYKGKSFAFEENTIMTVFSSFVYRKTGSNIDIVV